MADESGDIIIKGGSCEISFDHERYQLDEVVPGKRKCVALKIKQITISGDEEVFADYDTGANEDGFKGTIRIFCS